MKERTNLAAFTPAVPTPAYVSINLEEDGRVSISVRTQGDGNSVGDWAVIYLSDVQASELFLDAADGLARMVLAESKPNP